jgi:hypothetical protein
MNLKTKAVTQYKNYEFNSVAIVGENILGSSVSGIKILSGENGTDSGDLIDWSCAIGYHDLYSQQRKRIRRLFANMQSDGNVLITVNNENDHQKSYQMKASGLTNKAPVQHIAYINRSHNGVFYKLKFENSGRAFATIEGLFGQFNLLNIKTTGR